MDMRRLVICWVVMTSITMSTTEVSTADLLKSGQVVTLKIPISLLICIGAAVNKLVCRATITSSDGVSELRVNDRSDWETCCVASLMEFTIENIQLPILSSKPKENNPNTIVSLGSVRTSLVSLAFGPTVKNVEAAFAQLVIEGPAKGPAVTEYKAESYARTSSALFAGTFGMLGKEQKLRIFAFLAALSNTNEPPTKLVETYKGKLYFAVPVGGSDVYNTLQMNESARVARTINDTLLKVLKGSLAPLGDFGEAIEGVKVEMKILSRSFTDRNAEPGVDALQIYAPRDIVTKFAAAEITSQQFIDGCVVLVNDNRIQVPLAGTR